MEKQKMTIQSLIKKNEITLKSLSVNTINRNTIDFFVFEDSIIDFDFLMDAKDDFLLSYEDGHKITDSVISAMSRGYFHNYDEWKDEYSITNMESNNFYNFIKSKISVNIDRYSGHTTLMRSEKFKSLSDFMRNSYETTNRLHW